MGMDFESYLKKAKRFRTAEWTKEYNQSYKNGFDNAYNHLTKDLGEWAWKMAIDRTPSCDYESVNNFLMSTCSMAYSDIAVTCLGRKEVNKRLSILRELEEA